MRKVALYRRMLANDALVSVLSLDPYFPRHAARFYDGGAKVSAVPDPVHPAVACTAADRLLARKLPVGRIGFVLFGYLTKRKGALVILDALARLRPEIAARVAVMLAGSVDPAIADAIARRQVMLAATRPDVLFHIEDRRLEAAEIEALLDRADVVLAPYQRFIGSSGVLLWAARAGKPVLTQDFGLIGTLVREHGLGLTVDSTSAAELAAGMACMVEDRVDSFFDRDAALGFAGDHTPQLFAKTVLASLAIA